MENEYKNIINEFSSALAELKSSSPDLMKAFNDMATVSAKDGALTQKTKELIALAIGIAGHCQGCIAFHTRKLIKLGVTKDEFHEMLSVAVYMGGGPSLMYAAEAIKAYNELSEDT